MKKILRSAHLVAAAIIAVVAFSGCDPATPPAPSPSATVPVAVAPVTNPAATTASADHHAHAHGAPAGKSGKAKREVVRAGIESLDVAVDGGAIHLLLGDYGTNSSAPVLRYLRSTDAGDNWSAPIRVDTDATAPLAPHRGMDAQIAASGAKLVALWNRPGTGFNGRGPMATALSTDGGATWQTGPNPADDGLPSDHSFVDCAADAAGVFHLVWLDSRGGPKGLRYANSRDGGKSWSKNATLKAETCECCWNTLAVGAEGRLHVLFRDKNPRDMAVISSADNGARWGEPAKVGSFNWEFQGCPHVGGGLLARGAQLHALVWTGAAGNAGTYHLTSGDEGRTWSAPQRLGDADARRGDLASRSASHVAAVWDRVADGESVILGAVSNDAGKTWSAPRRLSDGSSHAAYPRVIATAAGYRVFWTESGKDRPGVWRTIPLTE